MKKIGNTIIIILIIIPLIFWSRKLSSNFSLINLSQILSISGSVLLCTNFILSTRLKAFEPFFGGLNKVYETHHKVGQYALILLCFHPILIGIEYFKISIETAFIVLFPPLSQPAVWFGTGALTSIIILLIITLFIKLPYHIWKLTHKFMGIPLLLASLHVFLIPSDVSSNIPLRVYMLGMFAVAIFAYLYRTILGRLLVKRYPFKVSEIRRMKNVTEIKLLPKDTMFNYTPGQFIFIKFDSKILGVEEHPFSLTSIPTDEYISISPKDSGDYTNKFKDLEIGCDAKVEGPFGEFSYLSSRKLKQVWVAGGIGITPFLAMVKSLAKKDDYDITLYYSVNNIDEAVYYDFIKNFKDKPKTFKLKLIETSSDGRLTGQQIEKDIDDLHERDIFLCGPPPMMKSLRSQLNALNIKNSHIFSEEFSLD